VSFGTYTTGFLIVIAGLICGASLMHVPTFWIVLGWIMLAGEALLIRRVATRNEGLDMEVRHKRDFSAIRAPRMRSGPAFPQKDEAAEGPTPRA
jgi:hypothetical protein